jgi:hypothetical protein
MRLQVVADQAGSKHTGDSRNRGKGGQPVWRSRRPIVEGMEMRTFGDEQVPRVASGETRFHVRTRTLRRRRFVTASVPTAVV